MFFPAGTFSSSSLSPPTTGSQLRERRETSSWSCSGKKLRIALDLFFQLINHHLILLPTIPIHNSDLLTSKCGICQFVTSADTKVNQACWLWRFSFLYKLHLSSLDSIAVSLFICRLVEFVKSEPNPNNNLMMRRAASSTLPTLRQHDTEN